MGDIFKNIALNTGAMNQEDSRLQWFWSEERLVKAGTRVALVECQR